MCSLLKKLWVSVLLLISIWGLIAESSVAMNEIKSCDVAIIGGGMAGLTTAYKLSKQGISSCLFEAKEYAGGRTHTHYFTTDRSQYYEEGGTIIDREHTNVISLAEELGVKLDKVYFGEGTVSAFQNGHQLSNHDLIDILDETIKTLKRKGYSFSKDEKGSYKNILTEIDKLPSENAKNFWKILIKDETGIEPKDLPIYLVSWLVEKAEEYKGILTYRLSATDKDSVKNYYSYRVQGGMSNLVNALQGHCTLTTFNFGHVLTKMVHVPHGFLLRFANQRSVMAKKIVIAIPFSTLRDVQIDENIGFDETTKKAIHNMPYGTSSKIGLPVSGKFNMLQHFNLGPKDQFVSWPGHNAVTIMLGGEKGKNLNLNNAKLLVKTEDANLKVAYPQIGNIGNPAIKNWAQDPYAKGSYSFKATLTDDYCFLPWYKYKQLCLFATPINIKVNRDSEGHTLFFAGEHTVMGETRATIEGAVQSGEIVAQIISQKK
jgi:monoamine oxidase